MILILNLLKLLYSHIINKNNKKYNLESTILLIIIN